MLFGLVFILGGGVLLGLGLAGQNHAPQPDSAQRGSLGPTATASSRPDSRAGDSTSAGSSLPGPRRGAAVDRRHPAVAVGPVLARSLPVSISIPSIGVQARLLEVGLNPDGTLQVPPLYQRPSRPAWYRYSPTPGQLGPSIIVGHVDDYLGPAVFFRLGALLPGARIEVSLQDGVIALFKVDGVRRYPKAQFPTESVYGPTDYAALRLLTCGGPFDDQTRSYLDNVVVYASLVGSERTHPVT